MNLISCTLTGIDRKTDLARVAQLSTTFPQAEFAILFSPERSGQQNRFPTVQQIHTLLTAGPIKWAIHLCGRAVPDFIRGAVSGEGSGEDQEVFRLATHPAVSRIQLNFAFRRATFSLSELDSAIQSLAIPVITQEHRANEGVSLAIKAPNHQVLFDASGGRGIEAAEWLPPLNGKICGFAGGLGPETLSGALPAIKHACAGQPFWIDMETRIRDRDDWLDLDACERVLEITQTT
ncbi:hypothetical protein [Microvirga sp. VF16]|uniref:hypothetical protein n=1 Tax=Microvirga sp. VF16 TaxID=2807101 RepID=UPI00193EAF80|nr:hypothetical protein [Microvirga sp. VF16]QRM35098.1 hypothetical protein JO965_39555 [Microvirga sp. VF16]